MSVIEESGLRNDRAELPMFNGARIIGPSVAAAIIAVASEGWCYSSIWRRLAVIMAPLAMRITAAGVDATHESAFQQFKEGWRYAFTFGPVRR